MRWEPDPPAVGPARLHLAFDGPEGQPLPSELPTVEGNMNHAGMRPSFAALEPAGPGRWSGTMDLTMGGDWFLIVTARLEDGRRLERVVDGPRVRSP